MQSDIKALPSKKEASQETVVLLLVARAPSFLLSGKCGLNWSIVRPLGMIIADMASVSGEFAKTAIAGKKLPHYNNVAEREPWRFLQKVRG